MVPPSGIWQRRNVRRSEAALISLSHRARAAGHVKIVLRDEEVGWGSAYLLFFESFVKINDDFLRGAYLLLNQIITEANFT